MSAFVINSYAFGAVFNPEAALSVDVSIAPAGPQFASSNWTSNADAVFACDLTIPTSPSGMILETGGAARGLYCGFRSTGEFVIRAGNGAISAPTASENDLPVIYLSSGQPSGTGSLVWEIKIAGAALRAWWNGVLIGSAAATDATFSGGTWTGLGAGTYLSNSAGAPTGEVATALAATSASSLRIYRSQSVP